MDVNYKAIDVMKFICAILVVIIHTNPFGESELSFIMAQNVARVAVPLFFITSGYLFWGKYKENKSYVYKYVKNIFKIIVIWSLVYLPSNIYYYKKLDGSLIKKIFLYIRSFLFSGTYVQLWYLNALIMSIILIVFLLKYLDLKKIGLIGLGLYVIGLLGDSYLYLFDSRIKDFIINSYIIIFESVRNGFLSGTIFITIGMLVREYGLNFKLDKRKNRILVLFMFIALLIETNILRKFEIAGGHNMMISLLFLAPLIFILVLNTSKFKDIKNVDVFRNLSLWIYCIHEVFIIISKSVGMIEIVSFIFALGCSIISYFIFEKIKVIFNFNRRL